MMLRHLADVGTRLRHAGLRCRLGMLGDGARIERGVRFDYPRRIFLGDGADIGHGAVIRANTASTVGVRFGHGVSIRDYTVMNANRGSIQLGDRSWVGPHCLVYGNGGVTIGSDVLIAGHTSINTVSHVADRTDLPINHQGLRSDPVVIEDDVWIGLNCTILQGVTIGTGSIIGAGAVVTGDIPPGSIAVGAPARVIRSRGRENDGGPVPLSMEVA